LRRQFPTGVEFGGMPLGSPTPRIDTYPGEAAPHDLLQRGRCFEGPWIVAQHGADDPVIGSRRVSHCNPCGLKTSFGASQCRVSSEF
jgi:hypothetical protein